MQYDNTYLKNHFFAIMFFFFLLSTEEGPPPFESVCYRPCENPPQPKTCDLGEWNVEWFIGGDSPFCENCLFEYDKLRDIYLSDPVIRSCPDCIPLDGITRAVAVINRKLPGPSVHVSICICIGTM